MRLLPLLICALLLPLGCSQPNLDEPNTEERPLFGPAAMRIHPIFTQVKDWTGDGKPDGVEVLLEFQDQFGDPTKAAGTAMFELYKYRMANPDPRGQRLANPWIGSITTLQEQKQLWNRVSRTYTFRLAYPQITLTDSYVLTVAFRTTTGERLFDRVVLEGQDQDQPTTRPTTRPTLPF